MVYRHADDADEGDLETGTRVCVVCDTRKPMTEFHYANGGKHRRRKCKGCCRVRAIEVRAERPDHYADAARWRSIKRKYGLTKAEFLALWGAQDGRCAICREEMTHETAHVDHDHESGAVRGLLCFTCNTALGKFHDSVDVLRAAIDYLTRTARPFRIHGEDVA